MAGHTEHIFIRGKLRYARVFQLNKYGKWSFDLYPFPGEDTEKLRELKDRYKVKNYLRQDDDGYYMSMQRPPQKDMGKGLRKRTVPLAPLQVLDANRTDEHGHPQPLVEQAIGDGTDATVKIELYNFKTAEGEIAFAIRPVGILVHNLVEWKAAEHFNEEEMEQISGLKERTQLPAW